MNFFRYFVTRNNWKASLFLILLAIVAPIFLLIKEGYVGEGWFFVFPAVFDICANLWLWWRGR